MKKLVSLAMGLILNPAQAQLTIDQVGDNNSVYVEQIGRHTTSLMGLGNNTTTSILQQGPNTNTATVDNSGQNNTIVMEQRNQGNTARSFDLRINGNGASVQVMQINPALGNGRVDTGSMNIVCPSACPSGQYQYIRR
jgi:hypothetical protein